MATRSFGSDRKSLSSPSCFRPPPWKEHVPGGHSRLPEPQGETRLAEPDRPGLATRSQPWPKRLRPAKPGTSPPCRRLLCEPYTFIVTLCEFGFVCYFSKTGIMQRRSQETTLMGWVRGHGKERNQDSVLSNSGEKASASKGLLRQGLVEGGVW